MLKKHGVQVKYLNQPKFGNALRALETLRPDVVLYSAYSGHIPEFTDFDRQLKQRMSVTSVIGGPGPTYNPHFQEDSSIDAICVGEGEVAITEFITGGFQYGRNIIRPGQAAMPTEFHKFVSMDDLPFPDREIVYREDTLLRDLPSKQFMAGRGCPYRCSYCFNHAYNEMFKDCGKTIRRKSVDYLIEEIQRVRADYPLKNVAFQDDLFIMNKSWLMEFCERFPREVEGMTFTCNIRANLVKEETIRALKEGGCVAVNWSIESGDDFIRNDVLKRAMSREQVMRTAHLLERFKIPHRTGNIIGLPGEKFPQMLETLKINIDANPSFSIASPFVPYPGLGLTEYAIKTGHLNQEDIENIPKKGYFRKSILNFDEEEKERIFKLMLLFPLLVQKPGLFRNEWIFNFLMTRIPWPVLRVVWDLFFTLSLARLYKMAVPIQTKARILLRYITEI